jgi:hypothetical protein
MKEEECILSQGWLLDLTTVNIDGAEAIMVSNNCIVIMFSFISFTFVSVLMFLYRFHTSTTFNTI